MHANRICAVVMGVCAIAMAVPAFGQTPTAPAAAAATTPLAGVDVGVIGGLSSVQNVGGLAGVQVAYRVTDKVHLVGEGVWMQDAVTRARLSGITTFGSFLSTSQGKTATATLDAPAYYGGASARFLIPMQGIVHPYAAVGGGMAKIVSRPKFTLGGADVTSSLATYGITLGTDFGGEVTKFALTGGVGLLIDKNRVSFDLGLRLTSVQTEGQKTNILRGQVGISYRF